ncbi:MAG: hypothetical protein DWQ20_04970, partial [Actinobacteria bacterium]
KVLTFLRRLEDKAVLVVANLSRHTQPVSLELEEFAGYSPVEVLGRARFPQVAEEPYPMTVGPHELFWFSMAPAESEADEHETPRINLRGQLSSVWRARAQLQRALAADIVHRRWFRSKARTIRETDLIDILEVPGTGARIAFLRVDYVEGDPENYVIPLSMASGPEALRVSTEIPESIIATVHAPGEEDAVLYDAMQDEQFSKALLRLAGSTKKVKGRRVVLSSGNFPGSRRLAKATTDAPVRMGGLEQTNTSVFFGEDLMMKLFRKVEAGPNPEVEVGRFLTKGAKFPHTPETKALVEVEVDGEASALAFFQEFVPAQANAFDHFYDNALITLETIAAKLGEVGDPPKRSHPLDVTERQLEAGRELMGPLMVDARLLGQRTGELHLALASDPTHPTFGTQPISTLQLRSLYQAIRSTVRTSVGLLKRRRAHLPDDDAELVNELIEAEGDLLAHIKEVMSARVEVDRIRIHGDYHLGQVLYTGKDFIIIDFEGEPQRPLSERRLKRLALRDVAGMVRSFNYAMLMALQQVSDQGPGEEGKEFLAEWAQSLHRLLAAEFLNGYLKAVDGASIVPTDIEQTRKLLDALIVEKAGYELEYEINNRPDWVRVPLSGILDTLR